MRKPLLLALLFAACSVETEEGVTPDEVGDVEQDYRQSQLMSVPYGATVKVNSDYQTLWTGTVLSDHWVLTAAHALPGGYPIMQMTAMVNGQETIVYEGPWTWFRYPGYQSGGSYDLGLIYLYGRGIDVRFPKRAKIYSGSTNPWASVSQLASWLEGYGDGPASCSDDSGFGMLKGLSTFTGCGGSSTDAYTCQYLSCDGDSGGPWGWRIWNGSAWDYLQYAVNHGRSNWYPPPDSGYRGLAAVVRPGLSWIQSTMNYAMYPLTTNVSTGTLGGYQFKTYAEQGAIGRFVTLDTNMCLDANGAVDGTPVLVKPCDVNSLTQRWTLLPGGTLHPYWYPYLCLRAPGLIHDNGLHLGSCQNVGDENLFRYNRYTEELHTAAAYGLCADRPSTAAGTHVLMRNCTSGASQNWGWTP